MARDGWPKNDKIFEGAKAVVFYMDGGDGHPILKKEHQEVVQKLIDQGVGFVNLHYAVEYPKSQSDHVLQWLGGYYETNFSTNPHWDADFKKLPEHRSHAASSRSQIRDEWYFNIRFEPESKGVTPILVATPPDNVRGTAAAKEHHGPRGIVAWAFDRDNGGRQFRLHRRPLPRQLGRRELSPARRQRHPVVGQVDVPKDGAKVDFDPADLNRNLDRKGKR